MWEPAFARLYRTGTSVRGIKAAQHAAEADAVDHASEIDSSFTDPKAGQAVGRPVQGGEFVDEPVRDGLGKMVEPSEVVVTVPLDVGHADGGLQGEILLKRDRPEVGQVFAALEAATSASSSPQPSRASGAKRDGSKK